MRKIFIDTSVFIRALTKDDEKKFEDCVKLFELVEQGKLRPYTSNIVILEIIFVLIRLYKFSKKKVLKDLNLLGQIRNLTMIEKTDTTTAMKLFAKFNIKYADCLIVTQVSPKSTLLTYDTDFKKIKSLKVAEPGELIDQ